MNIVEEKMRWHGRDLPTAELLQFAFDRLGDGLFWFDCDGRVVYANEAASRFLECANEESLGYCVEDFAPEVNAKLWREHWERVKVFGVSTLETTLLSKNGRRFPVETTISYFAHGNIELVSAIVRDISKRKHTEESMRLAAAIYMSSNEAVMVTNEHHHIIQINPAFTQITDYRLDELYGKNPGVLLSKLHDQAFYQEMWKDINEIGYWQGEMWGKRKTGECFASHVTISLIRNPDASIFGYVAQFLEITEKKRKDELIWQHANFDTLTTLPNRRLFHDRLHQEIKKSNRTGHPFALLFIDLDGFKQINDQFGHDMGDLLLIEVARRIEKCVRETDTVARLGGDEFTIILPNYGGYADIERIVRNIIAELSEPFRMKDETGCISASVGIALFPDDAQDIEALLKCADQAMYASKKKGRCGFTYASEPGSHEDTRNSYFKRRSIYFRQSGLSALCAK